MRFGSGWTSYFGDPESMVIISYIRDLVTGPIIRFRPITDYGQYYTLLTVAFKARRFMSATPSSTISRSWASIRLPILRTSSQLNRTANGPRHCSMPQSDNSCSTIHT